MKGIDRFEAADRVILSTGLNYPDALAGSAWAGVVSAPLYVVPGTCVPQGTLAEIYRLDASTVTLLGGTASLTVEVQKLVACGF